MNPFMSGGAVAEQSHSNVVSAPLELFTYSVLPNPEGPTKTKNLYLCLTAFRGSLKKTEGSEGSGSRVTEEDRRVRRVTK